MDKVRVLRVIEYVGERDWVEQTLAKSIQGVIRTPKGEIRAATVGQFPEILENLPEDTRESFQGFRDRTEGGA